MEFDVYNWVILPLMIMFSRVADVTLGTMRIILVTRGQRAIAPLVGFFEVLIWLFVMSQIMKNVDNIACYLAWATGFALGIYVGSFVESKIALGVVTIRIVVNDYAEALINGLTTSDFRVTVVEGQGSRGPVKVIYTVMHRKRQRDAERIIRDINPDILYSVEDLRNAHENMLGAKPSNRYFRKIASVGKWK